LKAIVEVSDQCVADLLCSALEGGSNYWYSIVKFIEPPKLEFRIMKSQVFRHIDYPMNVGGALHIQDKEAGKDSKTYILELASLRNGVQVMANKFPRHFADFVNENDDAITGDVFLQCCLFGDVIYG
jgi:hypothetical protein